MMNDLKSGWEKPLFFILFWQPYRDRSQDYEKQPTKESEIIAFEAVKK